MKKLIIATAIASVSGSVMANDVLPIDGGEFEGQPVDVIIDPIDVVIDPVDPGYGVDPIIELPEQPTPITSPDEAREFAKKEVNKRLAVMSNEEKVRELQHAINRATDGESKLIIDEVSTDGNAKLYIENQHGDRVEVSAEELRTAVTEAHEQNVQGRQLEQAPMPKLPGSNPDSPNAVNQIVDKYNADNSYVQNQIADIESQIDDLRDDMHSVLASTQAINASRAFLPAGHDSAIGVGLGGAGSEGAVAVGYTQRLSDNWTANANLSATSGNDIDVSYGAGVQYSW